MAPVAEALGDERMSSERPLLQMAPMLDVSYEDYRQFMRILTRRAQLWTEMVVDNTLIYSQKEGRSLGGYLDFSESEHPIVCQLGGSDPVALAEASQIVERWGYDEINLNVGCPSDRVCCKGEFGASLMKRPEHVRDCIHAMSRRVQIPVTVKTRLGVDDLDSPGFTTSFVRTVAQGGCTHFIMHARKAWLSGLSPAQNRTVPPLQYDRVASLCHEFPNLSFSLNGGINTLEEVSGLLKVAPRNLLGIMMGRATCDNPCMLWDVDRHIYGETANPLKTPSRRAIVEAYCDYLEVAHPPDEAIAARAGTTHLAFKPILGLFAGCQGNRLFRRTLDTKMRDKSARSAGPAAILRSALDAIEEQNKSGDVLDALLAPAGPAEAFDASLLAIKPADAMDLCDRSTRGTARVHELVAGSAEASQLAGNPAVKQSRSGDVSQAVGERGFAGS